MNDRNDAWETLERLDAGDMPVQEFEKWLYANPQIENALGRSAYLEFLSLDFRQPHVLHDLSGLVRRVYEQQRPGRLIVDRARRIARSLLNDTIDTRSAARSLARLHHDGNPWVPIAFIGIDSELDHLPMPAQYHLWNPEALARLLRDNESLLQHCRNDAREAARELLDALKEQEGA